MAEERELDPLTTLINATDYARLRGAEVARFEKFAVLNDGYGYLGYIGVWNYHEEFRDGVVNFVSRSILSPKLVKFIDKAAASAGWDVYLAVIVGDMVHMHGNNGEEHCNTFLLIPYEVMNVRKAAK